ncbi:MULTISPECIES: hypothetical protein [unclassified Halomonas]|uniref:hypothetical protein n=1 Tax=unclassified Halomonas TaxID=2609666 RepID=UPI0020769F0B|nr:MULTISPECIES: hypothetical protein [unclassified Halomonas]
MSNYTQWGKNVIFCGPAQMLEQANRKESPVAGPYLPGTVVHYDEAQGEFVAGAGSVSYVLDRDHLGGGFVSTAYADDDLATAFWPEPKLVLNVRTAAGLDIQEDEPMYIGADGVLTNAAPEATDGETLKPYCYSAETIQTGSEIELVAQKFI